MNTICDGIHPFNAWRKPDGYCDDGMAGNVKYVGLAEIKFFLDNTVTAADLREESGIFTMYVQR